MAVVQGIFIVYLLFAGILNLAYTGQNSILLRNFGLVIYENNGQRRVFGYVKIGLGILLLLPSVLGMPFLVSGGAAFIAIFYLIYQEKQIPSAQKRPGGFMRGMAISIAAISTSFIFFARPDNIELGTRLLSKATHYLAAEKAWQLDNDTRSTKKGDTASEFELSDFKGQRPVALIFGAHTCPVFSEGTVRLKEIYDIYKNRIESIVVYGAEPHPTDEWWLGESKTFRFFHNLLGSRAAVDIKQPTTQEERNAVAARANTQLLNVEMPLYVDTIDNKVNTAYTGMPTRIYLIDENGSVVFNQGIDPISFHPDGLENAIENYLAGAKN